MLMTDTCRDAATPAEIERARIYCVNWGAPLTSADMVAAAIAEQRAADAAEIAHLRAFRNVDAMDCVWLLNYLNDSGHGKFWKAVIREHLDTITPAPVTAGQKP